MKYKITRNTYLSHNSFHSDSLGMKKVNNLAGISTITYNSVPKMLKYTKLFRQSTARSAKPAINKKTERQTNEAGYSDTGYKLSFISGICC